MTPRHHHVRGLSTAGFHRIHYTEWGDPKNPRVLVCAHGLTRCGRDFDTLAQAMADHYRVVCPDIAGRGESDWLAVKSDYNYIQYMADMTALISRVTDRGESVHWFGTSMGGIIGMLLASQTKSPISRMVINDVGFFIPKASIERIAMYVGASPRFADFESVVMAVRAVSPFGEMDDETWRRLTAPLVRQEADGSWTFRYDPGIAETFAQSAAQDVDLSPVWRKVLCPVLLIRGADSDLLLRETFDKMCRKRNVRGVEFPKVGHAPMFQSAEQIAVVREFLLEA
ncbi:MAG: alpha/beta hydrolase [Betaproteobacteria bacterium]|nr:alpha/beta hydrolase [Betaproteobacteria bacterium]